MKRWCKVGLLTGALGIVAMLLASGVVSLRVGSGDHVLAAANTPQVKPSLVAVAIGQLNESNGDSVSVDLHAAIRNGTPGGALRFFDHDVGYYNGGVRTLSVDGGVIKVTGGGGLLRPDGSRIAVRYSAQFSLDGSHATITVQGKSFQYTMDGRLNGFVHVFTPPATG